MAAAFKYPIEGYKVIGNTMMSSGHYQGFDVDLRFRRMDLSDLKKLEAFLASQGWMI